VEDYEETTAMQTIQLIIGKALSDGDEKRLEFCGEMFNNMENDDD